VILEPHPFQRAILIGLNTRGRHVYGGTVSEEEIARRRAAGKRARIARRITRRNSK
jgi:hypothetical protein